MKKHYTLAARRSSTLDSGRCRKIMEVFALTPDKLEQSPILQDVMVSTQGITYVTGFSGAGKSTLLRLLAADHPEVIMPAPPERQDIPLIELLGADIKEAMEVFGWVGLGEAFLYLTPYRLLSDGQKARAQLALALSQKPGLIIADEFLSTLDRITAKVVAYSFQRICRKFGSNAVVSTAHNDLVEPLAPDQLIRLDLHGEHCVERRPITHPCIPEFRGLVLEEGTLEDYKSLSRFHYFEDMDFGEEFATEIYAVRHQGQCIGVSVLMAPYPADWEEMAYFKDVNDRVRVCIRLVVHPSFRGAGLAKLLMRPSLSHISYIETRSALALYQPIYLSAGYQAVELPGNRRTPLRDTLETELLRAGIKDTSQLHDPKFCDEFVFGLTSDQLVELQRLSYQLYVEGQVQDYLYYRAIAKLPPLKLAERTELQELFNSACDEIPLTTLLQETVFFPMQGFAVRHSVPGQ